MIEIRKLLHPHLRSIWPQVYYQRPPEGAQMPYAVYNLEVSDDGEALHRILLDIDGWDRPAGDTMPLENMMAILNKGLNKATLTSGKLAVSFYLETRLALTDEDPKVHRRRYTYQGRMFERGE